MDALDLNSGSKSHFLGNLLMLELEASLVLKNWYEVIGIKDLSIVNMMTTMQGQVVTSYLTQTMIVKYDPASKHRRLPQRSYLGRLHPSSKNSPAGRG